MTRLRAAWLAGAVLLPATTYGAAYINAAYPQAWWTPPTMLLLVATAMLSLSGLLLLGVAWLEGS